MITQKQLTLADFFEECKDIYESDKPQFLTLLENLKTTLTSMKLFRFLFVIITMHPLAEIINTH